MDVRTRRREKRMLQGGFEDAGGIVNKQISFRSSSETSPEFLEKERRLETCADGQGALIFS